MKHLREAAAGFIEQLAFILKESASEKCKYNIVRYQDTRGVLGQKILHHPGVGGWSPAPIWKIFRDLFDLYLSVRSIFIEE